MLSFFIDVMTALSVYACVGLILLRIAIALKIRWGSNDAIISIVLINTLSLIAAVSFLAL